MQDSEWNIRKAAWHVMSRIVLFVLYYIALVAVGVGIFALAAWATWALVRLMTETGGNWYILVVIAGIWALAVMFGYYLVRPLFKFTKNEKPGRVEVFRKDCPELFAVIDDIAKTVKAKKPKHVYLTADSNACVFFNTSFWSIFFPVRKNLEIGLGLCNGMSKEELKGVIAHEFGHFAQQSMRIGSTVFVANTVLYNLIFADESYEKRVEAWSHSDNSLWAAFGSITGFLVTTTGKLTRRMYSFVQKANLRLSRQMEYDADKVACGITGSSAFISGLCKIDTIARRQDQFDRSLSGFFGKTKTLPENYFGAYEAFVPVLKGADGINLSFDVPCSTPLENYGVLSRIHIDDVWASHPSTEDRIMNAGKISGNVADAPVAPAWSLIPPGVAERVSKVRLKFAYDALVRQLPPEEKPASPKYVSVAEYEKYASAAEYIPAEVYPFFNRIFSLDIDSIEPEPDAENPLTEDAARTVRELDMAQRDYALLQSIVEGRMPVKEYIYCGRKCNLSNMPFEEQRSLCERLAAEVEELDRKAYAWLLGHSGDVNKTRFDYQVYFYSTRVLNDLKEVRKKQDAIVNTINSGVKEGGKLYYQLAGFIRDMEDDVRSIISSLPAEWLGEIAGKERIDSYLKYAESRHNTADRVMLGRVSELFSLVDDIEQGHNGLSRASLNNIAEVYRKYKAEKI